MKFAVRLLAAAAALATFSAQAVVYTGTTVGAPTWTRPVAGSPPTPPLSSVGVAVPYSAQAFTVSAAGSYAFLSTATAPTGWDNYTFLYASSFNPTAQFSNVLIGNDDNTSIGFSGFSYTLTTVTTYYFVTSGYSPGDAGAFSNSITGPGTVNLVAVPEPANYVLMGLGVAAMLLRTRRHPA